MNTQQTTMFSLDDMASLITNSSQSRYDAEDSMRGIARQLLQNGQMSLDMIRVVFNKYLLRLPPAYACQSCLVQDEKPIEQCVCCTNGFHINSACAYEERFCSKRCCERTCSVNYCRKSRWPGRDYCKDCILEGKADTDEI